LNTSDRFVAEHAYEHTRVLCFPRRVGSAGEWRAARYITRQFEVLGLSWWRERFTVSFFPAEVASRVVFLACSLLVGVAALLIASCPLLAAAAAGGAALLVNAPWRVQRFLGRGWPPHVTSENLFASLPKTAKDAPVRVIFLAHYDTKSQVFPTGIRVLLVTLAAGACALLTAVSVAATLGFPALLGEAGPWWLAAAALVCLAGLVLNFTGNRCPGALDNGSAVGTLLELARTWRPEPDAPAEVVWVATGSEEVELDGARHLLEARASWWQDRPTLVINLESVGAGVRVLLAGEPSALRLARETADGLGMEHAPLSVLGAGMDHEPFAARGLPAVSILGDVVRKSFAMHSRRDNLGIIERPALERAGRLAAALAWRWARLHQPTAHAAQSASSCPA
jgi:hypothetical protein